jgi:hypothetical protein
MSNIRTLIQEKFGYTKDLPPVNDMHNDVTEGKKPQPSAHPLEEFRKTIKLLMGATTTEEDGIIENAIDFSALHRLANKHAFAPAFINHLNTIQVEIKKDKKSRDEDAIKAAWDAIRKDIPYWFVGLLPPKKGEDLPEEDKKNITNLLKVMDKINSESEKAGKEAAKETEHADRKTEAKKNLDAARKSAGMDKESGSEKKLNKEPENTPEGVKSKAEEPKLEEDPSKKDPPKDKKEDKK